MKNNVVAEITARNPGLRTVRKRRKSWNGGKYGRYANARVPYLEPILKEAEAFFSEKDRAKLAERINTDSAFHQHLAEQIASKKRVAPSTRKFARSLMLLAAEGLSPAQIQALFNTFNATRNRGER